MPKLTDLDIPTLGDWINLTEAANILGVSRSYLYKVAPSFNSLYRIGTQAVYVVSRAEVEEFAEARSIRIQAEEEAKKAKATESPGADDSEPADFRELSLEELVSSA